MKNLILLHFMLLFMCTSVIAQIAVSEDVHFNYYQSSVDNDFVNHFSIGNGLLQIQNNGITGGCLVTPDSINWGTDNAVYCSRYQPIPGDTTITSICFKYDSAGALPGSFQRAVSIWLIPYADFNHYMVASVTRNKRIEILSYPYATTLPQLSLLHGHWYRLELLVRFIGGATYDIYLEAQVLDLGMSGTALPVLVNSISETINDSVLVSDTAIQVSMNGTLHGGAIYLDYFHFEGREGFTNCINTPVDVHEEIPAEPFSAYPLPAANSIFIERNFQDIEMMTTTIYDIIGRKQAEVNSMEEKTELNISFLPEGIYLLQCRTATKLWTIKVMVAR